jgi:FixJ family two-component response regulator
VPEGPLIAVVDDDRSIRDATQDLLNAAGFFTSAFENAQSFLGSPVRAKVACLVTDMRMPGMTGLELHERLAATGNAIPTVIITAHPAGLTPEGARKAGIASFLIKPFTPDELLECVRKAIASSSVLRTIPKS